MPQTPLTRRPWFWAVAVALLAHAVGLAIFANWYWSPPTNEDDQPVAAARSGAAGETPRGESASDDAPGGDAHGGDAPGDSPSSEDDANTPQADQEPPRTPDEQLGDSAQDKFDELLEEAKQKSDEENLSELAAKVEQLDSIASEESVDEIADKFRNWIGAQERASEPAAAPIEGDFDTSTAQIHEVRREKTDEGAWRYVSVMVDAEGRTQEVELPAAQGKQAYDTLQIVKSSPFAEKIYRNITMPLLDQMIAAAEKLEKGEPSKAAKPDAETGAAETDVAAPEAPTPVEAPSSSIDEPAGNDASPAGDGR